MSVTTSTLNNGLRVVTDQMANLRTASVGVWVDAGPRQFVVPWTLYPRESG